MTSISPLTTLEDWLDDARREDEPAPEAMALATVSATGEPSLRMVSLKELDVDGLVFTTTTHGRKARDLAAAPRAALTFWWPRVRRQVRIAGRSERLERDAAVRLYGARPLRHRLQTLVSRQGEPIESLAPLRARLDELERRHPDAPPPCPEWFCALRVVPSAVEFWEERPDRLHDRIEYLRRDDGWVSQRLSP